MSEHFTERDYLYWLCQLPPLGAITIRTLLDRFGSCEAVYYMEGSRLKEEKLLNRAAAACFDDMKPKLLETTREYRGLEERGIRFITYMDEEYPERLKHIYGRPVGLYVKGRLPDDGRPSAAIIGARAASSYGLQVARMLGASLSRAGIQIVSGMALGIDGAGHEGALMEAFDNLPIHEDWVKPRVGIVGEILVKYMPLANNHLVELLEREGAEAVVPDLMDFFAYSAYGWQYKAEFLGVKKSMAALSQAAIRLIDALRRPAVAALSASRRFSPPLPIRQITELARPFLSLGNQYGEGWFLTGEMVELITHGVPNIVCIQPFACLPNHVVGKGVIKALKNAYPQCNIAAVDYDPGASEVNQLNRIKLMLSAAKKPQTAAV